MLDCLQTSQLDEAADAISEILLDFPLFFTPPQNKRLVDILTGSWAQETLQTLLVEPADELPRFVRLLLAYADNCLSKLAETPHDPLTQKIMGKSKILHSISTPLTISSLNAHAHAMSRLCRC